MNQFQIHQPKSYQEVPWRNGRGKTLLLLSEPLPGSGDFAWRLSIAGVDSDGPFSRFDDCDRTLVLLEGRGMTLTHGDGRADVLHERFALARFPGDVGTVATLHDGPIRDFNVMCQRHHCTAAVKVLGDGNVLHVDDDLLLAYAVDGTVRLSAPSGPPLRIEHRELLQYFCSSPGRWLISGGPVIAVRIRGRRAGPGLRPAQKS
ncbi:MAG TPA: HutD family protein [Woeseiaceae bacterium]|nr:HutD family protein [Woeseiaceae bacterium]